jgi:hypothetical protein
VTAIFVGQQDVYRVRPKYWLTHLRSEPVGLYGAIFEIKMEEKDGKGGSEGERQKMKGQ